MHSQNLRTGPRSWERFPNIKEGCTTGVPTRALELKNIQKNFGGVAALRDGNLSVAAGEVHLLMGENGAGKSTLMKIVAGMLQRDGGQMLWNARR